MFQDLIKTGADDQGGKKELLLQQNTSGIGLGLNFCKRIIEQLKGTITFKTKEGEGT